MSGPSSAAEPWPDRSFVVTLVTAGGILGFVAWDQSFWWRTIVDYRFGWLTPAFVAYAVFRRWNTIGTVARKIRAWHAVADASAYRLGRVVLVLAGGCLGVATLLFLFGALARAYSGPSHPGSLAIALGAGFMVLSLIFLAAPRGSADRDPGFALAARLRLTSLFLYPALIWLVTVPTLAAWDAWLSPLLLRQIERVVLAVFHLFHLPIQLQGNVFVLRRGPVALEEACLGLRSITGCIFGGLFLAEICLARWRSRAFIVGAALALALVTNFARVLFLNLWAHKYGPAAIEGIVHDASGWAVLGLTAIGLFWLTTRLERAESTHADAPRE